LQQRNKDLSLLVRGLLEEIEKRDRFNLLVKQKEKDNSKLLSENNQQINESNNVDNADEYIQNLKDELKRKSEELEKIRSSRKKQTILCFYLFEKVMYFVLF
jgi:hypothetical protein